MTSRREVSAPDPSAAGRRDEAMAEELWRRARTSGMTRRRFLELMAAGGAAAVLVACIDLEGGMDEEPDEPTHWFKDTEPFIEHADTSLEARLELMDEVITPARLFFVRNNSSASLDVDAGDWRLSIEGDAIDSPIELSYEEIRRLPSRTFVSYLECAGNQRAMFERLEGWLTTGSQWTTGGISNGEWTGVSLRDVLTMAGIRDDAVCVMLVGLDTDAPEGGFRRVMPVEKALHPDTILAYELNGEALPKDHGFPLRAIAPGWVGATNIKWLGRIVVSREQLWTRNNTTHYVLIGTNYEPEGEARGEIAEEQNIKSALALPWPAELSPGVQRLHGYAHSPGGPIERVEWSADGGASWSEADVLGPQVDYSWAKFEFEWDAAPGEHTIMTRATDASGETQPDEVPFNDKGYLFNQPLPHPITVT